MIKRSLILPLLFFACTVFAQKKIIVAKDGTGNCKTVQEAFDKIPAGNKKPVTIYVKAGIYKERLILDTRKDFVTLIGEDVKKTVLTYNNHAGGKLPNGDTVNTWNSASFFIYADNFTAKNITFVNDAGFTAGQAVALFVNGTRAAFFNCNLIGFQDVLFCSGHGSKQYYKDCYIEGTTDFIFGPATAVFVNCHIHSKKNSHVTAASTPREIPFGFVFINCKLTADSGLNKVSLGRPWQPNASVAYINCEIGSHIIAEGWNNWKNPDNEKTARFAEYKSYGPGANAEKRVSWSKQLTDEEVKKYTVENILGEWKIEKKK
ncbi:pectinesterase family protein [Ferruginibacter lapsinanis]|uniref:pectinesterase family protein n=1 Tax=Ferruginibacter lapsinanis TaxID=563172 RepID=UPI001E3B1A74|nr:pectinesterase family protein [Ferruginibacter lapsinanis]UEG49498.1 pectinesterase family protein [Ferruginibacter lapsinanis]